MDALESELRQWMSGRAPLWGLDFDGTLVDLRPDPRDVALDPRGIATLSRLSERYPCAIISGRSLEDLARHAPIPGAGLVGNHGCQMLLPGHPLWEWRSPEWEDWRAMHLAALRRWVESREASLEDKRFSLTVHFKGSGASRDWWLAEGGRALRRHIGSSPGLMPGHLTWNITAHGAPDKGATSLCYARALGLDSIIYLGDEPTDETVFEQTEVPVFGIKVRPGATSARHRIAEPAQALDFLGRFV